MAKKSDYFESICKVSRAFGTALDKDEILNLIVQSAIDTMNGKAACLFLADEEKDVFVPVAQKGLSDNYLHAKPMHAKKIVNDALKGGYLAVRDATTDTRLENLEEKRAEGIASMLVVPVMVKEKAIGVLSLYTVKERDFKKEEAEFMRALAEQGGMAIEQARLLERIRKYSALFHDLSSAINSSLDLKKIMHIMTAEIVQALGMKGVAILLLDENTGLLGLVASHGISEEFINKGPLSDEKSVVQTLKGETVAIKDAAADKWYSSTRTVYGKEMKKEGIVSMLSVPVKSKDKVIGVMRLFSSVKREFSEDTINIVSALAHQGALAIQSSSMYMMLQNDMDNLKNELWSHKSWF